MRRKSGRASGPQSVAGDGVAAIVLALGCVSACGQSGPSPIGMEQLGASTYIPVLAGHPDGTIFAANLQQSGMQESAAAWRIRPDGGRAWTRTYDEAIVPIPSWLATSPWAADAPLIVGGGKSVTKLSASGERLWTAACASWSCDPNSQRSPQVAATADGGALVVADDNRLIRLSAADGTVAWTSTAPQDAVCSPGFSLQTIAEAADGTVLLGGGASSRCDGTATAIGLTILRLDSTGRHIGGRTLHPADDQSGGVLAGLSIAPDGSILVNGYFSGTVDFGDGSGTDVLTASTDGASFAMKMAPDFSLERVSEAPMVSMMAATSDGGLLGIDHRGSIGKGQAADPHLVKLDADLRLEWDVTVADAASTVYSAAVAGNRVAVAGFGRIGEYYGTFVSRYRF